MTDKIADALNMTPLNTAVEKTEVVEGVVGVVPFSAQPITEYETEVDPQFEQACADFEEVRDNMRELIDESRGMFNEVKDVAIRTQDPEQYNAAARFLELSIRANRELLSTHRDIFAMKPPAPPVQNGGQQADQINNVFVATSASELLSMLAQKGIGAKR